MKTYLWSFIVLATFLSCSENDEFVVRTSNLELTFNSDGIIRKVKNAHGEIQELSGFCNLKGCQVLNVNSRELSSGAIEFIKTLQDTVSNRQLTLTETFTPDKTSIKWEVTIFDDGDFWTTPIETVLQYPTSDKLRIWMPWADPRGDLSGGGTNNALIANAIINSGDLSDFTSWADPLMSIPMKNSLWHYGAPRYEYQNPGILYCPFQGDVICIPMISFFEKEQDLGLSLVLSPDDLLLDVNLEINENGQIKFSRFNHRLGKGNEIKFSMDLVAHQADWRSSMGWVVDNYPEYFYPSNPLAQEIAGTGAYSNSDASFDVDKMKKMAFRVNWRASFDFPYMGMFIPPVDEKEVWQSFVRHRNIGEVMRKPSSIPKMQEYCKRMENNGFFVLSYFNVTEFGTQIVYPRPKSSRKKNEPIWKDANDYLYDNLYDAMLFVPDNQKPVLDKGIYSARPGLPFCTWEKAVAMDPGVKSYQDFLIEQAKRIVNELPSSYGICIDRMDWTRFYNHKTDDGVSWMGNQPVGSMYVSWQMLMEKIAPIFHDQNKVIFVNNHVKRIDQLKYVDGIFDEFTYAGAPLNTTALMCMHKPALGWMSNDKQLLPNPDDVMQKYLYMGVFPMAPFPGNDHSIRPSDLADSVYLDYGFMFDLLRGKEWVLKPNVISITKGVAKVNLFKTFHGYTIPVVYAGEDDQIEILVRDPEMIDKEMEIFAFYPGEEQGVPVSFIKGSDGLLITTPVKRNCAMLKVETK